MRRLILSSRLRKLLTYLSDTFWLVPGLMVVGGILLGVFLVDLDRSGAVPQALIDSPWLYNGGGTGARTLLGAVASSTIGVAGTVFSITIAALSLAAGQMGPRLLRNFTRDRGNQITLGTYLATFSYTLMVLRSVRTQDEGVFVPHLSLSVAILFALICVATLVFFVGHMAGRINVDTVVDLVSDDVRQAIRRLMLTERGPEAPDGKHWEGATASYDDRRGYLQHFDTAALADWAASHGACVRMLVRPGDYISPGTAVAAVLGDANGADAAIRSATALGGKRVGADDIEFAIRQLVEVAVRALSPAINDPHTAMSVLDRLGAALCDAVPLFLATGVTLRDGRPVLVVPATDYGGLTDTMFHMIRQNATTSPAVLIRMLEVLTTAASVERAPGRVTELQRHADLILADAIGAVSNESDRAVIRQRHATFAAVQRRGPVALALSNSGPTW